MEAHAHEAAPEECCGLLLGRGESITEAVRAHNRADDPTRRYEIDPEGHFAAIRHARSRALEVLGAYHSHPRSQPIPSPTDRAHAFEDFVFLIAGRSEDRPAGETPGFVVRAWRFSSGNFVEVPLVSDA